MVRWNVVSRFVYLHAGIAWYLVVMVVARGLWRISPRLSARWCLITGLYEACRQLLLSEQLSRQLPR
jgi:hypothetical protein